MNNNGIGFGVDEEGYVAQTEDQDIPLRLVAALPNSCQKFSRKYVLYDLYLYVSHNDKR